MFVITILGLLSGSEGNILAVNESLFAVLAMLADPFS